MNNQQTTYTIRLNCCVCVCQGQIQRGGGDWVASHPPSLVLLCNVVLEMSTIIYQPPPPPLHQYGLLPHQPPSMQIF